MSIKLEKNVEIPQASGKYGTIISKMEVGDSCFFNKVHDAQYFKLVAKRSKGFETTMRKMENDGEIGWRVWRTA